MSIKSDLTALKTNIQAAKDKLYTNLTEKGVTDITTASTLDAMADSVSGIKSGGGNLFETIGYEATPKYIQDAIDYSQTIYDNWDASITSCYDKFKGDKQLVYCPLVDTFNVTNMNNMFSGCTNLQYVPSIDTSKVTNMAYMFNSCSGLTSLNLSSFDTSNVTTMESMFGKCSGLTSLDVSSFNTSNVTNMSYMFQYCSGLTSLDVSSFNTSNVTNMSYMFEDCSSLTSLDVSSFNTSNVTNMNHMFQYCSGLTSLNLSGWDTSNVTSMNQFIYGSGKLNRVDGYISVKSLSKLNTLLYYYAKPNLYKITFKDLGYNSNFTNFDMYYATNWGVNSDTITDARQSLIDSLITYSFDRATNGYSTCTVTLATNTKAVLTEDEIAAITAKGFTIA